MLAVKAVEVSYQLSEDVLKLLETFKDMVNYCIQAGLENNITSRFRLTKVVYHNLMRCVIVHGMFWELLRLQPQYS